MDFLHGDFLVLVDHLFNSLLPYTVNIYVLNKLIFGAKNVLLLLFWNESLLFIIYLAQN